MRQRRSARIGTTWTAILRAVSLAGISTADQIVAAVMPRSRLQPDALVRWMNGQLGRMAKAGYLVRREGSPTPWAVGQSGSTAIEDASSPMARRYKSDQTQRLLAQHRRDKLRLLKLCINGAAHGAATHGCRCSGCHDTHRKSA